jgi:hypothetical protein
MDWQRATWSNQEEARWKSFAGICLQFPGMPKVRCRLMSCWQRKLTVVPYRKCYVQFMTSAPWKGTTLQHSNACDHSAPDIVEHWKVWLGSAHMLSVSGTLWAPDRTLLGPGTVKPTRQSSNMLKLYSAGGTVWFILGILWNSNRMKNGVFWVVTPWKPQILHSNRMSPAA